MLTLVMAYYQNGGMLARHIAEWAGYSERLRPHLRIILVDDGSPTAPALPLVQEAKAMGLLEGLDVQVYRIGVNIPWNQNGARNLAMHVSDGVWHLLTDMDHLLPLGEAKWLAAMQMKGKNYYVPSRVQSTGADKSRHPNSFIVTRKAYWEAGGYDEDFCGSYGSDRVFRRALDTVANRVEVDRPRLVLFGRDAIPDASTTEWGRKDSPYHSASKPHLVAKRKSAPYKATNPLRFPWERQL